MRKMVVWSALVALCNFHPIKVSASPKEELAESIIVVLDEDSQDYQEAVFDRLTPKVTELQRTLAETLREVRASCEAHRKNPSMETSLTYEEAVSKGLQSINERFEAILEEEEAFETAAKMLEERLETMATTLNARIESTTRSASVESEAAAQHEDEMFRLANLYRDILENGQALPKEVNEAVAFLDTRLRGNRQRLELRNAHALRMEEWKESVNVLENGIRKCTSCWRSVFNRVCEDQETVAVLVDIQADEAEIVAAVQRVSSVLQDFNEAEGALTEFRGSFDGLLKTLKADHLHESNSAISFTDWANAPDQTGVTILKGYLEE
jgi:hypothetical protein